MMRGLMKVLMAAVAALIIGFGAGEVFGPQALEAGDPGECTYQQCWILTEEPWAECRADEEPFFCEELQIGEEIQCVQQHCYEPE